MNMQKALDLIQLAKSYQCKLFITPPDQIRWSSPVMPPQEFIEELKANKYVLLEYFKQTDRDLSTLVKRAFDGYRWLLDCKKQHNHYKAIPISEVRITVVEWRCTVKNVLKINDAELNIIESLLIQGEHLKYADTAKAFLTTFEEEQQEYLLDDETGTAFNNWLNTPREFVFS
ncbi:hypothetical protein [Acinetobacter bereziniae]|uniref:hypothetical protein n=1 Tax=Acinetobacter bereziniae TaxID=106648 RepID=UPI00124F8A87|nr:hypothetical protein [Acinetobacter bereziniae]